MFGENRRIWMEHVPRCKQCHQLSKLQVTVTGKQLYKKLLRKLHQHLSLTTYLGLSKTNDVQRAKSTSTPPVPDFCFLPIVEVPGGNPLPREGNVERTDKLHPGGKSKPLVCVEEYGTHGPRQVFHPHSQSLNWQTGPGQCVYAFTLGMWALF